MNDRLRVGMNLLWLRPGIVGGTEPAATATIAALAAHAADRVAVSLYAQPAFVDAHPELAATVPTVTVAVPGGSPGPRVLVESTWLPFATRRDAVDVVHCYGGVVPPGLRSPTVLTIHDVQPLETGSAFRPVKKRWLGAMLPRSVAAARIIAVPSGFVRERVVELLDVDPDRVVVIPHSLDLSTATGDPRTVGDADLALRRFGLDHPYVLYPAITYPHKNHRTLVEAFARLDTDARLVLAGGVGPAERDVAVAVERSGIGDRVRRVGRVSDVELAGLLTGADVVAFPSRYEGFGLPVLEALGADRPVVAARAGALPEVLGDAGTLVDPDDVEGWTDAIGAELDGAAGDRSERRRKRLAHFEWRRTTPLLVDAYRRAVAGGGPR